VNGYAALAALAALAAFAPGGKGAGDVSAGVGKVFDTKGKA
jgi:hypothetical protein